MTTESIGQRIRNWRKIRGITQEQLARQADMPYTTLSKIESNVIKNPSIETVKKISEGLDITIDELIN
jgi:transcriptional regulator with XRE-family HTH domain